MLSGRFPPLKLLYEQPVNNFFFGLYNSDGIVQKGSILRCKKYLWGGGGWCTAAIAEQDKAPFFVSECAAGAGAEKAPAGRAGAHGRKSQGRAEPSAAPRERWVRIKFLIENGEVAVVQSVVEVCEWRFMKTVHVFLKGLEWPVGCCSVRFFIAKFAPNFLSPALTFCGCFPGILDGMIDLGTCAVFGML